MITAKPLMNDKPMNAPGILGRQGGFLIAVRDVLADGQVEMDIYMIDDDWADVMVPAEGVWVHVDDFLNGVDDFFGCKRASFSGYPGGLLVVARETPAELRRN